MSTKEEMCRQFLAKHYVELVFENNVLHFLLPKKFTFKLQTWRRRKYFTFSLGNFDAFLLVAKVLYILAKRESKGEGEAESGTCLVGKLCSHGLWIFYRKLPWCPLQSRERQGVKEREREQGGESNVSESACHTVWDLDPIRHKAYGFSLPTHRAFMILEQIIAYMYSVQWLYTLHTGWTNNLL